MEKIIICDDCGEQIPQHQFTQEMIDSKDNEEFQCMSCEMNREEDLSIF